MTSSPQSPRLAFSNIADALAALRERGLRVSTARRLVLEALFAADGPVSAEHLARQLTLDVASVYRNLETLEQHGLAQHVHLGHGPGLYVLVGRGQHEFLSCEHCGAVRTVTPAQLDPVRDRVRELFGYEAHFTHFAIVGRCPACAHQRQHAPLRELDRPDGGTMSDRPDEHEHDGTVRDHARAEHDHVEHEHQHSHGDHVHSHPHVHQEGVEGQHEHGH
jgi:Fur family ferric uptake transcriptional regulator